MTFGDDVELKRLYCLVNKKTGVPMLVFATDEQKKNFIQNLQKYGKDQKKEDDKKK